MMSSKKEARVDILKERPLRSLPPTYASSLVFSHGKKYHDQTFCTLSDGCYHVRSIPEMRSMKCVASYYGWLILQHPYSTECCLFNPITLTKIQLPPLGHSSFDIGIITSYPDDPDCVIMFFSKKKKSCIFCRVGDKNWIIQVLGSKKKNPMLLKHYVSATTCNGKIYLFLYKAMAEIVVHGTSLSIKPYKREFPNQSLPETILYQTFFVESCGEIFEVHTLHLGLSEKVVRRIDVFKLDLSTISWVKVKHLGDRIFLLGKSSTSLPSSELGVKGNCIYFCIPRYTGFYRFDMEDMSITSEPPFPNKLSHWFRPCWVVPDCKVQFQVKKEVAKVEEAKCYQNEKKGTWENLPLELLELILSFLFQDDCIRFRLCCKSWISISPPIRLYSHVHIQNKSGCQQLPWLLSFLEDDKGQCSFYHPIYGDSYTMNNPELVGATARHAKYGWLLMSRGEYSIFFFNPFTLETIKLPDLRKKYSFINISFSSSPTSSDCVVFGHYLAGSGAVVFSVYRKGEDAWSVDRREFTHIFLSSYCNPIFCDGVFYTLGKNGRLGIFDPNADEDEDQVWRFFPKVLIPEFGTMSGDCLQVLSTRCFLVEYEGDIVSVFMDFMGRSVSVYKLDRSKMEWVRLESLGEKVIFLSQKTSMLVPAGVKGTEDRIYFPRFDRKEIMFYSLRSGKYHSFGGKDPHVDWSKTKELWNCTWIKPEFDEVAALGDTGLLLE